MSNSKKAKNPPEPTFNHFVIVLAYESDEGELPDEFVEMARDIKALFSLKDNMRMYALVEESANNVLAQVEEPL